MMNIKKTITTMALAFMTFTAFTLTPQVALADTGSTVTAPTSITASAEAEDYNTVDVSWASVDGANQYLVYMACGNGFAYESQTSGTSYTLDAVPGVTYKFVIVAVSSTASYAQTTLKDAKADALGVSEITEVRAALGQSTLSKTDATYTTVGLSWTAVDGATSYQVYKKSTGSFKKVATTSDTSYECTNLREGTSYKFVVKAVRATDTYTATRNSNVISARTDMRSGRARLMSLAKKKLGCSYVSGAAGPTRFDCSGYVYYCYKKSNASTKKFHRTSAQGLYSQLKHYNIGTDLSKAAKGDIVLCGSSKSSISHAAMAYSSTKIINAANPRRGVCVMPARYFHIVAIIHLPANN
ncbi:MAG: NlpC/P60 family protein [Eubacteriaceae bacterium]|jgi:cell wall-associated NlpC family hydrolase|nr:NlpC/P60 family protein [Eubacteriaceae bacterium]